MKTIWLNREGAEYTCIKIIERDRLREAMEQANLEGRYIEPFSSFQIGRCTDLEDIGLDPDLHVPEIAVQEVEGLFDRGREVLDPADQYALRLHRVGLVSGGRYSLPGMM